jgi:hypothetical protein
VRALNGSAFEAAASLSSNAPLPDGSIQSQVEALCEFFLRLHQGVRRNGRAFGTTRQSHSSASSFERSIFEHQGIRARRFFERMAFSTTSLFLGGRFFEDVAFSRTSLFRGRRFFARVALGA